MWPPFAGEDRVYQAFYSGLSGASDTARDARGQGSILRPAQSRINLRELRTGLSISRAPQRQIHRGDDRRGNRVRTRAHPFRTPRMTGQSCESIRLPFVADGTMKLDDVLLCITARHHTTFSREAAPEAVTRVLHVPQ